MRHVGEDRAVILSVQAGLGEGAADALAEGLGEGCAERGDENETARADGACDARIDPVVLRKIFVERLAGPEERVIRFEAKRSVVEWRGRRRVVRRVVDAQAGELHQALGV